MEFIGVSIRDGLNAIAVALESVADAIREIPSRPAKTQSGDEWKDTPYFPG